MTNLVLLILGFCVLFYNYLAICQYVFPLDHNISRLRTKRTAPCIPTVKILNCPPAYDMYLMMTYQFSAEVKSGCSRSTLLYEWDLLPLEYDYKKTIKGNEKTFIIPELSAMNGKAMITLKVTEVMIKAKESDSTKCYVEYQKEAPVPIINGGDARTVAPNIPYTADATNSINFGADALKPLWSVECSNHASCSPPESFVCPKPKRDTGMKWTFNTRNCTNFKITLKLVYDEDPEKYPATVQILNTIMESNVETTHLQCLVNCMSAGYIRITQGNTGWYVICDNNCDKDSSPEYEVEIKDNATNQVISNQDNTAYYSSKRLIIVRQGTLKIGKNYTLTAWIQSRTKHEYLGMNLQTYLASQNECNIKPTSGTALETLFEIDCSRMTPKEYMFQIDIYQPSIEEGPLVMQSSSRIFKTQLVATDPDSIYIELTYGKTLYTITQHLTVKVAAKKINVEETLTDLKKLRNTNEVFKLVMISETLLTESEKMDEKARFQLQAKVLNELSKVKLSNPYSYKTMSNMIKTVRKTPFTEKYAGNLKEFCGTIKTAHVTEFDGRYQDKQSEGAYEIRDVRKCLESDLKGEATLDASYDIDTADGKVMEDERIMTENYPNYDAEFGDDIAQEAEDTAFKTNMEKTMKIGHKMDTNKTLEYPTFTINKYNTDDAFKREYTFKNYHRSYVGSYKYEKEFPKCKAIISTSTPIDPISYLVKNKELATSAIDISTFCVKKNNKTKALNVPIRINFNTVSLPNVYTLNASLTLSGNFMDWTNDYLNEKMIIHRLDVFKADMLFIEFGNLTDNAKLKIAVTKNIRPNVAAHKKLFVVDASDEESWKIHPRINTFDCDCWIYIGVLIHEDMLKNSTSDFVSIGYNISFSKKTCFIWNKDTREWDPDLCKLKNSSNSQVECLCHHSSIFAARALNLESTRDPYDPLKPKLKLTVSYIIFFFVACIFGLYCIAFCFAPKRNIDRSKVADIYFLADNLKNDLYAYLIVIKTGKVGDAGTTSNIMISIVGTMNTTKAHVLNYPDPDKELLQKDTEQWFILTVDKYLGQINSIKLWFDSIGYRPSWFCETISIIDLQRQESCYFYIQSWMGILENCHYFIAIPIDEDSLAWNNKILENFSLHFGAGHTWNIFSRAHDREFSYVQRITILLAQILNVYLVAILIHGSPELRLRDSFSIESFDKLTIIIIGVFSGLISFLINIVIVTIFRHSNESSSTKFVTIKKVLLPKWAKKYAWAFLIININLSIIYLTTFGFWLPRVESIKWMASAITGLFVNIFMFESFFISLHEIFIKYYKKNHTIFHKSYRYKNIIKEIEHQRMALYNIYGEFLLRPYLRHLYNILAPEILIEKKLWYKLKLDVARLLRDFIIFIIYFIIIYILFVFTQRQFMLYDSNARLTSLIGQGDDYTGFPLDQIKNYEHIYDYIKQTLIPALNGKFWYSDWRMDNAGTMSDFSSKVIGVAQIRQQRMDFETCSIQLRPHNTPNLICHSAYLSRSNHSNRRYFRDSVWIYKNALQTNLPTVKGDLQSYDGGGFIAKLGRSHPNSQYVVEYLRRRKWIDINTKVVIIDFWAYNAYYNLFSIIQIIIERAEVGFMLPKLKIFSAHLLHIENIAVELFYFVLVVILGIIITIIMITQLLNMLQMRKRYFKQFWHYYDWVLIIIIFMTIFGFMQRSGMVKAVMQTLASSQNNDFVLYFHLVRVSQFLVHLSALTVCLVTLRLWKYLRFVIIFRTLEGTIIRSAMSLFIIVCSIEVLVLAYSGAGHIMFGSIHPSMITIFKTNAMLLVQFLGIGKIDTNREVLNTGYRAKMYKSTFMLISLLLKNIVITIIVIYLKESKQHFSNKRDKYTIIEYVKEEYNYYSELYVNRKVHVRLRAGGLPTTSESNDDYLEHPQLIQKQLHFDPSRMVYPKALVHRFANSMRLSSRNLRLMTTIANVTVLRITTKKTSKLIRKHYEAMAAMIVDLAKKNAEDAMKLWDDVLFYNQKASDKKVKLLFDDRLLDMEYIIKRLVEYSYFDRNREDNKIRDIQKFSRICNHLHSTLQCIENIKFMLDDQS